MTYTHEWCNIGIDSVVAFKKWSQDHIEMLNLLCHLMAQGLIKKRADIAMYQAKNQDKT